MINSLKEIDNISSDLDALISFLNDVINAIKIDVNVNKTNLSILSSKVDDLILFLSDLNSKLTVDVINTVSALGTTDDFEFGLNDALNNLDYGTSAV